MTYRARLAKDTWIAVCAMHDGVAVSVECGNRTLKFWPGTLYPLYVKHIYTSYWFFRRKPDQVFRKQILTAIRCATIAAQKAIQDEALSDIERFSNSTLAHEMLCQQFRRADIEAVP